MAPEVYDSGPTAPFMLSENEAKPPPLRASASTSRIAPKFDIASTSRIAAKPESKGFLGISDAWTWRPKFSVKNPDYPKVSAPGCFFISHSGGFQLIHRATSKCLGFYTRAQIKELESKYATKKRKTGSKR
jgi:hypothetical protein